jgi:hypothetical protein
MTTTPSSETLVVPGPGAVPALVPHLLGFAPSQSVVLLGLAGPRHQVRVTLRADLPPAGLPLEAAAPELGQSLPALARAGSETVILVVYPGADDSPWTGSSPRDLPRRDLVEALASALQAQGLGLDDALCVVGDRVRSYICTDPACCPPEGFLVDSSESLRINASFVVRGSAPLQSREGLATVLEPRPDDDPLVREVERTRMLLGDCESMLSVPDVDSFLLGLAAWGGPGADSGLLAPLVALATALCQRIRPRDLLLRALAVDCTPEHRELARVVLTEAVRCALPEEAAPVAAVLAVVAWLGGDGAFSRTALDRAFACDPAYSLAALVSAALDHGTPPWEWAEMMRDLSVEAILDATQPAYPEDDWGPDDDDLLADELEEPDDYPGHPDDPDDSESHGDSGPLLRSAPDRGSGGDGPL